MIAVNTHNENSMVQEWNLQLEQQFGGNNVVNIAYVGTEGAHLSTYYPYNINQFDDRTAELPEAGQHQLQQLRRHFQLRRSAARTRNTARPTG